MLDLPASFGEEERGIGTQSLPDRVNSLGLITGEPPAAVHSLQANSPGPSQINPLISNLESTGRLAPQQAGAVEITSPSTLASCSPPTETTQPHLTPGSQQASLPFSPPDWPSPLTSASLSGSNLIQTREIVWVLDLPQISGTKDEQSFWDMSASMRQAYDTELFQKWEKRLSNLAFIAGLLVAAGMGFWPVTADDTLRQVLVAIQSLSSNSSTSSTLTPIPAMYPSLPGADDVTQPDYILMAQTLWEFALNLLLLTLIVSVPANHVIQRYSLHLPTPLPDLVRERQRRFESVMRLGMPVVIVLLELFIGLAALLLIGGLVGFHINGLRWMATAFITLSVAMATYLVLLPVAQDKWSLIPYDGREVANEIFASYRWMKSRNTDGIRVQSIQATHTVSKADSLLLKKLRNIKVAIWVGKHTTSPAEREACLRSAHAFGPVPLPYFDIFREDLQWLSKLAINHCVEKTSPRMLMKQDAAFRRDRIAHLAAYAAWVEALNFGEEASYELKVDSLEDFVHCVNDDENVYSDDHDGSSADEYALLAYSLVLRAYVNRIEVPAFNRLRWFRGAIGRLETVLLNSGRVHVFGVCLLLDTLRKPLHQPVSDTAEERALVDARRGMQLILIRKFLRETMNVPLPVLQCCLAMLMDMETLWKAGKKPGVRRTHALLWTEDPVVTMADLLHRGISKEWYAMVRRSFGASRTTPTSSIVVWLSVQTVSTKYTLFSGECTPMPRPFPPASAQRPCSSWK
ncbi:hypothetical protein CALVIDRAFT_67290 [Calocera viscosa TUFC12733]|uniref:DUF6535 domain-containing protein n=1 Tax=Calocera viscosa (strain TUFC12733) TaxID=1330018 RepID=A0A167NP17_CALVF|nr:hypothetical protein CALVIDRAFT_67290 [Calocera viscosa TUFC12733]